MERGPQLADDPTGAPLPRALQGHLAEAELHADRRRMRRDRPVNGEQGQLHRPLAPLFDRLDAAQPRGLLTVVDLPEIEEMPIDCASIGAALLLRDTPVAVLLAVFHAAMAFEVHGGLSLPHRRGLGKRVGLYHERSHEHEPYLPRSYALTGGEKS